jgi:DNA-binding PadR family transcriptional regulator
MNADRFTKDLAAGSYDLIVLDVLRDGPAYGYGIVRRIAEQSRHTIRWHLGTVYHVLHHLEKQGLVTSRWEKTSHERKYYRLTPRGRAAWRRQRAQWRAFTASVNGLLAR